MERPSPPPPHGDRHLPNGRPLAPPAPHRTSPRRRSAPTLPLPAVAPHLCQPSLAWLGSAPLSPSRFWGGEDDRGTQRLRQRYQKSPQPASRARLTVAARARLTAARVPTNTPSRCRHVRPPTVASWTGTTTQAGGKGGRGACSSQGAGRGGGGGSCAVLERERDGGCSAFRALGEAEVRRAVHVEHRRTCGGQQFVLYTTRSFYNVGVQLCLQSCSGTAGWGLTVNMI